MNYMIGRLFIGSPLRMARKNILQYYLNEDDAHIMLHNIQITMDIVLSTL